MTRKEPNPLPFLFCFVFVVVVVVVLLLFFALAKTAGSVDDVRSKNSLQTVQQT